MYLKDKINSKKKLKVKNKIEIRNKDKTIFDKCFLFLCLIDF